MKTTTIKQAKLRNLYRITKWEVPEFPFMSGMDAKIDSKAVCRRYKEKYANTTNMDWMQRLADQYDKCAIVKKGIKVALFVDLPEDRRVFRNLNGGE